MTFEEMLKAGKKPEYKKHHNNEEHKIQASCVRWFRMQFPSISYALFAIPNGARRTERNGAYLKEEGMLAGVSDMILLKSNRFYGALCIEMKTKSGRLSKEQQSWKEFIETQGCKYVVCRSLDDFIKEVNTYMADE